MRGKKGTHVGIVLSFVLFITFLTFMFALIKFPFSVEQRVENSIDLIKESLTDSVSSEITTIFISNSSIQAGEDCLRFSETSLNLAGTNQVVKDKNMNTLNSKREGEYLYVDWVGSQPFFKIFYTNLGFNNYSTLVCINSANASVRNVYQSETILESKIISKIYEYNNNYESLKSEMGVSNSNEFSFQFEYENKTRIGNMAPDLQKDIFLKSYLVDYLDLDGTEEKGEILIYLW
jgi:hypothetical protein